MNSNFFRMESVSSIRFAKAMSSGNDTEPATYQDLYDLYLTGIALLDMLVRSTIRRGCEDKSLLSVNTASLYAKTPSLSR